MLLYHGTSREYYESITQNGFGNDVSNWDCSVTDYTYFWSPDKMIEVGDIDPDDNYTEDAVLRRAFESAQVCAALHSKSDNMIVIRVEVDEQSISVTDDDSCRNMQGAVQVNNAALDTSMITGVFASPFSPKISLFILADLIENENINMQLSPLEIEACKSIHKSSIFMEELWEFDYKQIV